MKSTLLPYLTKDSSVVGDKRWSHVGSRLIVTVILVVLALTTLAPLFWMVSASLKIEADVFRFPIEWIPSRWNAVENYTAVWEESNFALYYWNSIKVAVLGTLLLLGTASLAAYAFSKMHYPGREFLFWLYIASMMIPIQVTLVPRFMIVRWLGLYDSHAALILMGAFSAYAVFLLRQNMKAIPDSLCESAQIDGAKHFQVYWHIVLPVVKPALAVQAILKFIWTWNNYQMPLIFLKSEELFTIQLGLSRFADESGTIFSLVMAGSVSAILPLLIVFMLGQRYILKGITVGSVKG
ncbi:MAG: carbohydrate ABC transporter permease [Spirochaetales bacterium]